ncbi:D-sedoheptulose 7-phosphate isomerase [Mucilaginibacter daejeonensis]|uniref:D-sedoheptulose-7-phosphate isomerase n=1 Tax=Mucilaginibacter daejeonensis TaxID=398049 RepID=UPI001D174347|nr:D-sedoheptulose 7-phosphate isomerase [Mucilaginibacter daejeonensis]UEG54956.1 D-sedoheptulose 7-phosphate isomerase [Mucilaginibacter daejeonensis]
MDTSIQNIFGEHIQVAQQTREVLSGKIEQVCTIILDCLSRGNKVLLFGNGGSASDAQHIAAEFVGRFVKDRRSYPAIALTTDTSALTAIGNDYGFERVFERQVEGLAVKGDVVIGISTSGNSPNVLRGLQYAKKLECAVIGMSGNDGGAMNALCDINLVVPSTITARIQEMHILTGHIICQMVDERL